MAGDRHGSTAALPYCVCPCTLSFYNLRISEIIEYLEKALLIGMLLVTLVTKKIY